MNECPHCGFALDRKARFQDQRGDGAVGNKSTASEIVSCPDCDGVIDGFSAH